MREIIFRAWDGKKLSIGKEEYFDDSVNFRFDHFDIDCDKPVLEQYTGLKDRNGKMLFEGDIVLVEKCSKGVIRYIEKEALFAVDFLSHLLSLSDTTSDYIEIIGNIHEEEKK
jgi:uncharacterized phage protein (TIGR01671 family)